MAPSRDSTRRRALVLRHHLEDDAGLVGRALIDRGFEIETVLVDATHPAPDELVADLLVVLGSSASAHDSSVREAWLDREMDVLARAGERGTPIFGICFGAQVLCTMFGGVVEPAPIPEVGWFTVDVATSAPLSAGPWFEYHYDRCVLPERAVTWATTRDAVQAFTIGRHVGVQFHPEIDGEQLARWFDSQHGASRAYSDDERALLEETRAQTPAATQRTAELVDVVLAHAFAAV